MKIYFEYVYYRVTKLFSNSPTDRGMRAVALIAMIQSAVFLTILEILLILVGREQFIRTFTSYIEWVMILTVFCFGYFAHKKYDNPNIKMISYWESDNNKKKRIRDFFLVISLIILFIAFIKVTIYLYRLLK